MRFQDFDSMHEFYLFFLFCLTKNRSPNFHSEVVTNLRFFASFCMTVVTKLCFGGNLLCLSDHKIAPFFEGYLNELHVVVTFIVRLVN